MSLPSEITLKALPLALAGALMMSATALADDVETVLKLWGQQGGPWTGEIEIYGPDGGAPQTLGLKTNWDATPDHTVLTKIETFTSSDQAFSAVTVMYSQADGNQIITPYFSQGRQQDFRFAVLSVSVTDSTNWTTVIASPDGQETYEDRPAVLRYVRTRKGNHIENTKEVDFLDDDDDGRFELRSLIRQSLAPEG